MGPVWPEIGIRIPIRGQEVPAGNQFYFAVKHGLWYARSPEITSGPVISAFAWARVAPDIVFAAGAILLLVFVGRAIWLTFIKKVSALEGDHHWQPPDQSKAQNKA